MLHELATKGWKELRHAAFDRRDFRQFGELDMGGASVVSRNARPRIGHRGQSLRLGGIGFFQGRGEREKCLERPAQRSGRGNSLEIRQWNQASARQYRVGVIRKPRPQGILVGAGQLGQQQRACITCEWVSGLNFVEIPMMRGYRSRNETAGLVINVQPTHAHEQGIFVTIIEDRSATERGLETTGSLPKRIVQQANPTGENAKVRSVTESSEPWMPSFPSSEAAQLPRTCGPSVPRQLSHPSGGLLAQRCASGSAINHPPADGAIGPRCRPSSSTTVGFDRKIVEGELHRPSRRLCLQPPPVRGRRDRATKCTAQRSRPAWAVARCSG